jgi:hypothetical protein
MTWILIIFLNGGYGLTVEFNSQVACNAARTEVIATRAPLAICVGKGWRGSEAVR